MRFMVIVKANANSEAGVMPSQDLIQRMGAFNEELIKAGVMLAGDGLQSSAKGARLSWTNDSLTVTDGPFPETKELIAGYWMVQMKSKDEVIEWFSRCPPPGGDGSGEIEIRQVFDAADFAEVATPEQIAREEELRAQLASKA